MSTYTANPEDPNKWFVIALITAMIALVILLATSCKPHQAISTTTTDSTYTKTVTKYDTTYIEVQGPIEYLENPCQWLCDSLGHLKPFTSVSKRNGIKQSLTTKGNVLIQRCDVDSLLQVNEILTIENNHYRNTVKEVPVCYKPHLTKWDSFWRILGEFFTGCLALYVIYRGVRMYLTKH